MSASFMLVCAVFASLAFGVLAAYVLCQAMFRAFRLHSLSTARLRQQREAAGTVRVALEG